MVVSPQNSIEIGHFGHFVHDIGATVSSPNLCELATENSASASILQLPVSSTKDQQNQYPEISSIQHIQQPSQGQPTFPGASQQPPSEASSSSLPRGQPAVSQGPASLPRGQLAVSQPTRAIQQSPSLPARMELYTHIWIM